MKNRWYLIALWGGLSALSSIADTITVDGVAYENVIVDETPTVYYIRFPETGNSQSVLKEKVAPEDVRITENRTERRKLQLLYKKTQTQQRRANPALPVSRETPGDGSVRKLFVGGDVVITNLEKNQMRASNPKRIFEDRKGVTILTNLPEKYEDSDAYIERTLDFQPIEVPDFIPRLRSPTSDAEYTGEYDGEALKSIKEVVSYYARRYGLEESLVYAVIRQESNFNPNAVSRAGARGLMQLMPATALEMGVRDIFDPAENIAGGTQYLSKMLAFTGGDVSLALAAYNAGPARVKKSGFKIPNIPETQDYVRRVLRFKQQYEGTGIGDVRLAKAHRVRRSQLPQQAAGEYEVVFINGLTQPADVYREEASHYLFKYGGRVWSAPKDKVKEVRKAA